MSDLIARLQKPFLPSANGAYDGGIRLPLEARQELMDAAAIRIEAAAALEAKDAEIAKAQEDYEWASQSCAAWRKDYDELQGTLGETTLRYTTEIAALKARIAAAEAALRPFAWAAEDLDDNESGELWERPAAMSVECAHLRAAAAYFAAQAA